MQEWHKPELVPPLSPPRSAEQLDTTPVSQQTHLNWHQDSHTWASRLTQKTTAGIWVPHCHAYFSDEETKAQNPHRSLLQSYSAADAGDKGSVTGLPQPHAGTPVAGSGCSIRSPAPRHTTWKRMGTTSLCLRFWYLAEKACNAQAKNKGSNKSLVLVNYSVSHYCLKTP